MAEYNPVLTAPKGANKKRKIVGRGSSSGLGTTAGKGNKGAQSRSGSPLPYVGFEGGQMPLYRRIAQRGFSNYPFKVEYEVVNLSDIEAKYSDGETVSKETLVAKKLIKAKKSRNFLLTRFPRLQRKRLKRPAAQSLRSRRLKKQKRKTKAD